LLQDLLELLVIGLEQPIFLQQFLKRRLSNLFMRTRHRSKDTNVTADDSSFLHSALA
jgi:hypothetical protein